MARKAKRAESTWRLPSCPTNEQLWNPRWEETRGLRAIARRGSLVAVNSFGTVRLFDIADPHAVETLFAIALPEGSHAPSEGAPIGFDREGHVVLTDRECLHVVDVKEPKQPRRPRD